MSDWFHRINHPFYPPVTCSTILFRHLHCLISIVDPDSSFTALIPAVLAPLLSIFIFSGSPLFLIAFLRNLWAALLEQLHYGPFFIRFRA